mmetsp:Transcript_1500/g.4383  ORF Transcript_1500/g.4383 Transcript_1500/m.4383 type:complete len:214 (+) Transcript_1500:193-834(+)
MQRERVQQRALREHLGGHARRRNAVGIGPQYPQLLQRRQLGGQHRERVVADVELLQLRAATQRGGQRAQLVVARVEFLQLLAGAHWRQRLQPVARHGQLPQPRQAQRRQHGEPVAVNEQHLQLRQSPHRLGQRLKQVVREHQPRQLRHTAHGLAQRREPVLRQVQRARCLAHGGHVGRQGLELGAAKRNQPRRTPALPALRRRGWRVATAART